MQATPMYRLKEEYVFVNMTQSYHTMQLKKLTLFVLLYRCIQNNKLFTKFEFISSRRRRYTKLMNIQMYHIFCTILQSYLEIRLKQHHQHLR